MKNDLLRLKRKELLEIMLAQSEEIDSLKARLAQVERQLAERKIQEKKAGSIAEASLAITKIFEEAQKAADIYLENVKTTVGESDEEKDIGSQE